MTSAAMTAPAILYVAVAGCAALHYRRRLSMGWPCAMGLGAVWPTIVLMGLRVSREGRDA